MNDDEDNSIRIYLSGDLTFQKLITKREQISKDEQNTHKQNMKEMQIYII
jgi:ribosomal protein S8